MTQARDLTQSKPERAEGDRKEESNMIEVYTDGSCIVTTGAGGWAAIVLGLNEKEVFQGHLENTTNNQMEINAVIRGLEHVPRNHRVAVFSDSQYVINTMTKGWRRKKNNIFWSLLDEIIEARELKVEWQWVRGHNGDPLNEEADKLAYDQARNH